MTPALLAEWRRELQRRVARAQVLVNLGLPDPGFDFLSYEVMRFRAAVAKLSSRAESFTERRAA